VRRILCAVITFLAGLGLLVVVITVTPLTSWWTSRLMGPWNDPPGEILVVLASDATENMIGFDSYWRAVYAVRVFRQGGIRNIVLTGGPPAGSDPIAITMARFLESQGVPREVIILETRANSTRENALFTKPLLANLTGRKVLLTSDYHMWRAIRTFHKAGIDIQPRPIPDLLKQTPHWLRRWAVFLELVRESGKIGYYFLRRWI
jgi:uncharacterized SAM-binding protein YcdF (DUF218 family)